jgi:hypothetical protein
VTPSILFYPVGKGDMTLIETQSGKRILIDINIRKDADDPDDDTPDVASWLRDRLSRDQQGRLCVDAMLLSHPDEDHCRGLEAHFHLGAPEDWNKEDDKILIREMWSSPIVFRRASKNHTLCSDAKAFNKEAKRRVAAYRDSGGFVGDGNRILILGEDEDGKTDDLQGILIKLDQLITRINGLHDTTFSARLLAPLPKENDDDEDVLTKNNSSVVLQFVLGSGWNTDACRFLTGGDAEVIIWERLWERHEYRSNWLNYDILLSPHHCSWHSLSHDSWSKLKEKAQISEDARAALSQTRDGAVIVASSPPIQDDDNDPPCIRAKREYVDIVGEANGDFYCVGDNDEVLEFIIEEDGGPRKRSTTMKASAAYGSAAIGSQPLGHG